MLVISSRISGWRVTDSITLPKMKPMPMPAPTAPSPPPIPIPSPAEPDEDDDDAANNKRWESTLSSFVSVGGGGATDVDRGQDRKDERLERGDQPQLEEVDEDAEGQGEPAQERQAENHRQAPGHEQDDHVAGQDVGEQPDGQRDQ